MKKKVEVVAGIIINQNEILCVQRAKSKLSYISEKFEFPGGKLELGETREEALHRELKEELDLEVSISRFYMTVVHEYPDFELTMHAFLCEAKSKALVLHEHIDSTWRTISELEDLNWAAADVPIVEKLLSDG